MIIPVGLSFFFVFFFQAEDGIRDLIVTGVQTCALPIFMTSTPKRSTRRFWRCSIWGVTRAAEPERLRLGCHEATAREGIHHRSGEQDEIGGVHRRRSARVGAIVPSAVRSVD